MAADSPEALALWIVATLLLFAAAGLWLRWCFKDDGSPIDSPSESPAPCAPATPRGSRVLPTDPWMLVAQGMKARLK